MATFPFGATEPSGDVASIYNILARSPINNANRMLFAMQLTDFQKKIFKPLLPLPKRKT